MRVLRVLLAVIAVCAAVAAIGVYVAGAGGVDLGTLWNSGSPGSLNLTQAVVQRYIHPAVWTEVLIPVLLMPAVGVFTPIAVVTLLFWLLLMWRRRSR
jgi:hypothetical protein